MKKNWSFYHPLQITFKSLVGPSHLKNFSELNCQSKIDGKKMFPKKVTWLYVRAIFHPFYGCLRWKLPKVDFVKAMVGPRFIDFSRKWIMYCAEVWLHLSKSNLEKNEKWIGK